MQNKQTDSLFHNLTVEEFFLCLNVGKLNQSFVHIRRACSFWILSRDMIRLWDMVNEEVSFYNRINDGVGCEPLHTSLHKPAKSIYQRLTNRSPYCMCFCSQIRLKLLVQLCLQETCSGSRSAVVSWASTNPV